MVGHVKGDGFEGEADGKGESGEVLASFFGSVSGVCGFGSGHDVLCVFYLIKNICIF